MNDQPEDSTTQEATAPPQPDEAEVLTSKADELTEVAQLRLLAEALESGEPVFVSQKPQEQTSVPGTAGKSWFIPRPLTGEQALTYKEKLMRLKQKGSGKEAEQEAEMKAVEPLRYLLSVGLQEIQLSCPDPQTGQETPWHVSRSSGETTPFAAFGKAASLLAPRALDWLNAWLRQYNGLTDLQEKQRGN